MGEISLQWAGDSPGNLQIGHLPEERSLMPKLTVLEQVRYLATLKGMDAKEVKEKLPQWMEKTRS